MAEENKKPVKEPHPVKQEYTLEEVSKAIKVINKAIEHAGDFSTVNSGDGSGEIKFQFENDYVLVALTNGCGNIIVELSDISLWNAYGDNREENGEGRHIQTLTDFLLQELDRYAGNIQAVVKRLRNPQPEE